VGDTMRKSVLFLYITLILYTLIHLVFFFSNQGALESLLKLEGDPLLLTLFNLLGIYPLAFMIFSIKYMVMTKKAWIPLILSFGLGGFAVTPLFIKRTYQRQKTEKYVSLLALVALVLSVMLLGFGLILGDYQVFIDAFLNDSFIHIMTIDFIALTILSILVSKQVSKSYWISAIPLVGFLYMLFSE
jgi:hypothetical protein